MDFFKSAKRLLPERFHQDSPKKCHRTIPYECFSHIVQKFINFKKGGNRNLDWTVKAIQTLILNLSEKNLAILEYSLYFPDQPSKCVMLHQPNAKPNYKHLLCFDYYLESPAVISCRIWRWPDLELHSKLEALQCCEVSHSSKWKEEPTTCINPFHYRTPENVMSVSKPFLDKLDYGQVSMTPSPSGTSVSHSSMNSSRSSGTIQMDQFDSLQWMHSSFINSQNMSFGQSISPVHSEMYPVDCQEKPTFWCSVRYFEYGKRFGDVFKAQDQQFIIDGLVHKKAKSNRFSLGSIEFPISINSYTQNIDCFRYYIGDGIELSSSNYEVRIKCISNCPVFVCSPTFNEKIGFPSGTVLQMVPGSSLPIFDGLQFASTIRQTVDQGYKAMYELTKKCTILISFVEGWGNGRQRVEIQNCPCWISIDLHEPMICLDKVLSQIEKPDNPISSVS